MRRVLRGMAMVSASFILSAFLAALAFAVHEPTPDMEHGESATAEPVPASVRVGGGDVSFEVKDAGNVVFSHGGHVSEAGLKCTDCHDALFVTKEKHKSSTMAQMQKGQSCGACHDGKKAFSVKTDCGKCHVK